jgi:CelD/BcsL family acetyltransferase involved in cellulose biosynthesis
VTRASDSNRVTRTLRLELCDSAVRLVLLHEIPEDATLRQQWNALVLETQGPQVFYTWEWAVAMQRSYGSSLRALLFLDYAEDGTLCAVAALASDTANRVSFLCATTGDYCDFVVSAPNAEHFAARVVEKLRESGYRDIVLTNFPDDSPSFVALNEAAKQAGFRMYGRTAYVCAQVRLPDAKGAPGSKLELPRRRMVQRSLKALAQAGPVTTEHESTWESVHPQLPELAAAQVSRLLANGKISNLIRPERCDFLRELTRLLSLTGWLCFTRMKAGSRTIAWHYGFKFYGRWSLYQLTFVNDLEKHSPGFVLLFKLIEEAALDPVMQTADLGVGTEAYKEAFANASRRTMYVTLHRSRWKHWWEMARYRATTEITKSPWAERTARTLRAKTDGVRRRLQQQGLKATLAWAGARVQSLIFSREEVFFFEGGTAPARFSESHSLRSVSYELLAEAAMRSYDDEETMQYLLRSAKRQREGTSEGFALVDAEGRPLHFAWITEFDGFFLSELNATVKAPAEDCVMILDCWTPPAERGHAYYAQTVGLVAQQIREKGKQPWIFSAASNVASIRGLEKAGFQLRYSLMRERVLGWQRIKGETPRFDTAAAEVSARV